MNARIVPGCWAMMRMTRHEWAPVLVVRRHFPRNGRTCWWVRTANGVEGYVMQEELFRAFRVPVGSQSDHPEISKAVKKYQKCDKSYRYLQRHRDDGPDQEAPR